MYMRIPINLCPVPRKLRKGEAAAGPCISGSPQYLRSTENRGAAELLSILWTLPWVSGTAVLLNGSTVASRRQCTVLRSPVHCIDAGISGAFPVLHGEPRMHRGCCEEGGEG